MDVEELGVEVEVEVDVEVEVVMWDKGMNGLSCTRGGVGPHLHLLHDRVVEQRGAGAPFPLRLVREDRLERADKVLGVPQLPVVTGGT